MRRRPGPDRIPSILHDIQADLDAGLNVGQALRKAGIGQSTNYRGAAIAETTFAGTVPHRRMRAGPSKNEPPFLPRESS
jgi:putative transposase